MEFEDQSSSVARQRTEWRWKVRTASETRKHAHSACNIALRSANFCGNTRSRRATLQLPELSALLSALSTDMNVLWRSMVLSSTHAMMYARLLVATTAPKVNEHGCGTVFTQSVRSVSRSPPCHFALVRGSGWAGAPRELGGGKSNKKIPARARDFCLTYTSCPSRQYPGAPARNEQCGKAARHALRRRGPVYGSPLSASAADAASATLRAARASGRHFSHTILCVEGSVEENATF